MPFYRVREGYRFGAFDQHGPGAVLEFTEEEARGFLFKMELVEPEESESESEESEPEEPEAGASPSWNLSNLTVDEVLALVEDGQISAGYALDKELAGKNRVTLIRELERFPE